MYEDGYNYAFDPNACEDCGGNCCTGESGYIFLNQKEMEGIAQYLELPMAELKEEYLFKKGYKFSIKERITGESHDCIFFDREKTVISDPDGHNSSPVRLRTTRFPWACPFTLGTFLM